jgi:hypothetical protein
VALRELGYDDEQVHQLRSDRRKSQALQGAQMVLDRNQVGSADNKEGAGKIQAAGQVKAG